MVFRVLMEVTSIPSALLPGVARERIASGMVVGVNTAVITMNNEMKRVTPKVTALTANAWQTVPATVTGDVIEGGVRNSTVAALVLEEGAKPHFPPSSALAAWIRAVKNETNAAEIKATAFRIGRKFKRKGRPALKIFSKALNRIQAEINSIMERTKEQIIKRLSE